MAHSNSRGFTLVEMVVAVGLLAIVVIGVLNLLDTSSQISKVEAALTDTQENVRFAAYHIMRTVRMTGGGSTGTGLGEMPFARADGTWVCGRIQNNQSGTVATEYGNVDVAAGTDVLTLRGLFEAQAFFTNRFDIDTTAQIVTIRERRTPSALADIINPLDVVPLASSLEGRGLLLMGRGQYAVGEIIAGAAISGTDPARVLTLPYGPGSAPWPTLNPDGTAIAAGEPAFDVYRVGILESYVYYVDPDLVLRRLSSTGPADGEPIAVNIGSLQVNIGIDTSTPPDGIVDLWDPDVTAATVAAADVMAMQVVVFGRTPFEVPQWNEPDGTFAGVDLDTGQINRGAKWRRMQVAASLRNFVL
jgi:prepilin-type N-terminal cleavage/methylation domain-containing protein